jgi:hypothetical protein
MKSMACFLISETSVHRKVVLVKCHFVYFFSAILFFMLSVSPKVLAVDYAYEADQARDQGGLNNYKKALGLYLTALKSSPGSYELHWKTARAFHDYAEEAQDSDIEGWKEICAEYGRLGMEEAQKAIAINGGKVEGYYYYGLNIGVYADGITKFTALAKGLKAKTQHCFEMAYTIDKMFDRGGPILALARFWAVLPWPLKDKKKALTYYRDYQRTPYFSKKADAQVYFAELLLSLGKDENRAEAITFLKMAAQSDNKVFSERAKQLLLKLKPRGRGWHQSEAGSVRAILVTDNRIRPCT